MSHFRWVWTVVFLFGFLISRSALAQEELKVDVRPAAASLDAEALRRGITDELRDTGARGDVIVDVDAGELVVIYGRVTRRVPMPAEPADARKAAIALAGNLARDEAAELAAALRKKPVVPPAPPATTVAKPAPEPEPFPTTASLHAALAVHAARERQFGLALGTTTAVLGAGALTGAALMSRNDDLKVASGYAFSGGVVLLANGVTLLLFRSPYERLAADPNVTEEDWAREAENERSWRKVNGVIDLVAAGAMLGVGTVVLADRDWHMSDAERQSTGSVALGFGVVATVVGIWRLATPGPLEKGLVDWRTAIRPSAAVLPGGGMASVTISF